MTLGSLFDGIGGFPLAASRYGIKTLWSSDIEPTCETVTKHHFQDADQLGDIAKINGTAIPPVTIIAGGSPCQDLSVAGKRAGLEGARSGLFMDMIRIIKEMRDATNNIYPRYAVWENVPGAFSSNKGADFQAVIEEFCRCADPNANVPRPAKWGKSGAVLGDGYSFAWRTVDAQFWGVPQRRRRIYAVLDLGGQSAPEILFKPKGLRGDSQACGTAGESAADHADGSVGRSCIKCLTPDFPQSARIYGTDGVYHALSANATGGLNRQSVLYEPMSALEENWAESSVKNALRAGASKSSHTLDAAGADAVCYGIDRAAFNQGENAQYKPQFDEDLSATVVSKGPNAVCYPVENHPNDSRISIREDGVVPTLSSRMGTGGNNGPMVLEVEPVVNRMRGFGDHEQDDTCSAVKARDYKDATDLVCEKKGRKYVIRRLTPMECERLQGFPDRWTDIPHNGKPMSDSARYRMLGNSVAVPCVEFVMRQISASSW